MENISAVFQQLKKELERVENEASRFRAALAALGSSVSNRHRRTMSAAARKKISLVQKARWAKQNGQAAARPTRPVSAAARRKMAAAQRARWAKVIRCGFLDTTHRPFYGDLRLLRFARMRGRDDFLDSARHRHTGFLRHRLALRGRHLPVYHKPARL